MRASRGVGVMTNAVHRLPGPTLRRPHRSHFVGGQWVAQNRSVGKPRHVYGVCCMAVDHEASMPAAEEALTHLDNGARLVYELVVG